MNDLGIIPDGSLLIRDGVLAEVGPSRRVENLAQARNAVEISAAGRVVMPGFVDSHTHLIFPQAGGGGEEEDAVRAILGATGQRLAGRARVYLDAMARHGTTTVEAKSGCGPDVSAETKVLRALSTFHRDPVEVIPTFLFRPPASGPSFDADGCAAAVDWAVAELLPRIRRRRLARFADVEWGSDPAKLECLARYLEAARRLGFPCKIHADQSCSRVAIATVVKHFAVSIDHLERASAADADLLAGCATVATLMPSSSLYNGGGPAPARALIDAGAAVALASNFNPWHTPALSMQTVVSLACLSMGMTAAEAISAATINGAHALGCGGTVGSLELGKLADLVILNVSDYRDLASRFGMNLVQMTMKHGEFIYEEGKVGRRTAESLRPAW